MRVLLAEIVAPLATLGALTYFLILKQQFFLGFMGEKMDPSLLWVTESFLLSLSMILVGLATLLEWDVLLLDQGDLQHLGPLPIRPRILFLAKVASLLVFVGSLSLVVNGFSALLFPSLLTTSDSSLTYGLWLVVVHSTVLILGNIAVFCFVLGVQALLMFLAGGRFFQAVSLGFRLVLMVILLTGFVGLPYIHASLPTLKEELDYLIFLFPPLWFVDVYQMFLGQADEVFSSLGRIGLLFLTGTIPAVAAAYTIQYRRHVAGDVDADGQSSRDPKMKGGQSFVLNRFLRHPIERAIFSFEGHTLLRSPSQRLLIGGIFGVGVAMTIVLVLTLSRSAGAMGVLQLNGYTLSVAHLLLFFSLVGVRIVFDIPANLEVNWLFQLTQNVDLMPYFSGIRKAVIVLAVLPQILLWLLFYGFFWGWTAAGPCIYAFTLAMILIEVLFTGYRKLPFTCTFVPEKANLKLMWSVYLGGFAIYVFGGTALELWLLGNPVRFLIAEALLVGSVIGSLASERRRVGGRRQLIYEEQRDPAVLSIQLNP